MQLPRLALHTTHVVTCQNVRLLEAPDVLPAVSVDPDAAERKDTVDQEKRGRYVRDPVWDGVHNDEERNHHKGADEEEKGSDREPKYPEDCRMQVSRR